MYILYTYYVYYVYIMYHLSFDITDVVTVILHHFIYYIRISQSSCSKEEAFEATALGPGSYIGELGLFYDRTCMEDVCVRGEETAALWRLRRTDFFDIIDRLEEEIEGGECQLPEILDREPASVFVVSDGSGYSAGGAVNLALKQFENQETKNCDTVSITSFPYIRYKGEIQEVAKRARQDNALIVYTLMRKEPRQAMLEELNTPVREGENPCLVMN